MGDDNLRALSQVYQGACNRMHEACTSLYESLHDLDGEPVTDVAAVYDAVSVYRKWLLVEADLVREAVKQHTEEFNGQ